MDGTLPMAQANRHHQHLPMTNSGMRFMAKANGEGNMAKIQNLERLKRKLKELPLELKKGIIGALAKGAQDIVDLQWHLCPFDTGDLRNSIDWSFGEVPRGVAIAIHQQTATSKEDLKATIYAGNELAYYARWVEFGTRPSTKGERINTIVKTGKSKGKKRSRIAARTHPGTAAQPFFYPGYRTGKKKAKAAIVRASNLALKKAASIGGTS